MAETGIPESQNNQNRHSRPNPRRGPDNIDKRTTHQRQRKSRFDGSLTSQPQEQQHPSRQHSPRPRFKPKRPAGDDLTSRLTYSLSTPPYTDCPICFSAIHPAQPIWSCSPSQDSSSECCYTPFHLKCIRSWAAKSVKDVEEAYAARGEHDRQGEWRCPGCQKRRVEVPKAYTCFCGSTISPALTRLATPHSCGNPCSRSRPSILITSPDHSSSLQNYQCTHSCPLTCHPGPCPPCQIAVHMPCHCGHKEMTFKCRQLQNYLQSQLQGSSDADTTQSTHAISTLDGDILSCGTSCGKALSCGRHVCARTCHANPCSACVVTLRRACWCGSETRIGQCGEPISTWEVHASYTVDQPGVEQSFEHYSCGHPCTQTYDCGVHSCEETCHSEHPSSYTVFASSSTKHPCPLSPTLLTHCPCGKVPILPPTFPLRTTCTDPVPTCGQSCDRPLPCGHRCSAPCHISKQCPPCGVELQKTCRCGAIRKVVKCADIHVISTGTDNEKTEVEEKEVLCDKPCTALRACGRHRCGRVCCPLAGFGVSSSTAGSASTSTNASRNRNRQPEANADYLLPDLAGLHECDLVCGKPLSCGNHKCEEQDHKGPCKPCLRSSFDELICHCTRTVLEPPIPCGTPASALNCPWPCARPPPPCGHPPVPHTCHGIFAADSNVDEREGCPVCVYLVTKLCACGKKEVGNVRCSTAREKVRCGSVCGKLMNCGFHHCERQCHADACGDCTVPCGKARKLCLPAIHPCTHPCHAPAACSEVEPCQAVITITCLCGRIKKSVHCGRSSANINNTQTSERDSSDGTSSAVSSTTNMTKQLKCNSECQIAKRNARLADALGINAETRERAAGGVGTPAAYNDETVSFARANTKFLALVEKAFADFVRGDKKTQVLPHMPPERRKFVHDLAVVYRMDTQMVDQEPHRSVQLLRRLDTRIPSPLLSAYIANINETSRLGSSVKPASNASTSWRSVVSPKPSVASTAKPLAGGSGTGRGWTAVVARSANTSPSPSSTPIPDVSRRPGGTNEVRAASPNVSGSGGGSRPRIPGNSGDAIKDAGTATTPVLDDWEDDVDV